MNTSRILIGIAAAACLGIWAAAPALAHDGPHKDHDEASACHGPELACAAVATPAFAPDGTLWLTWAAGKRVSVAASRDGGRTFAAATTLPPTEFPLDDGPDARPRVVVGPKGDVYVTYASRDDKFNGHAFLAHSRDGKSFSAPLPITTNSPSQRFETVVVDSDGRAFAAWIDKRNGAAAKKAKQPYAGAALAVSWIDAADRAGDPTIAPATIAKDNTCECCRIAVTFAAPGKPVVMFRNIFEGGIRDHAVISFEQGQPPGPVHRVSDDDAKIDSCPHHGPSLAVGPDGVYHATWAAMGRKLKGIYYAHSSDDGATFSTPLRLGDDAQQISRPFVLAQAGIVHLVYKAFDGSRTRIELMTSRDAGTSWSTPRTIAETDAQSDHPLLLADGDKAYLSWLTRKDGYRLIAIEGAPGTPAEAAPEVVR